MGTWRIGHNHNGKVLVYDFEGATRGIVIRALTPPSHVLEIPENDVAKLVLFLQGCGEAWQLARGETGECTASPPA